MAKKITEKMQSHLEEKELFEQAKSYAFDYPVSAGVEAPPGEIHLSSESVCALGQPRSKMFIAR